MATPRLSLTIRLSPADADRRLARKRDVMSAMVRDQLKADMRGLAAITRDRAEQHTPVRTGRAAKGWTVEEIRDGFRVLNTLSRTKEGRAQLLALEYGAEPHPIAARRARVLRFRAADGDVLYRRAVRHPGNPAYAMLRLARALGYQDLGVIKAELSKALAAEWGKP